jgi:cytochrome c biogenesis protein CcmG/thiol:disulfide interchange protein DsbE
VASSDLDRSAVAAETTVATDGGAPSVAISPARKPRKIFFLLGVVLAIGLGIGLFTGVGTKGSPAQPVPGGAAPSFSLPALVGTGRVGTPADGGGNGRPAVVLFFASWCPPCHAELPALAAVYRQQHQPRNPLARVAVIGVDGLDPTGDARSFVRSSGVTFPVGDDGNGNVTEGLYFFTGDPEAVFISAGGTIVHIEHGPTTPQQLVTWERRLLKAKA